MNLEGNIPVIEREHSVEELEAQAEKLLQDSFKLHNGFDEKWKGDGHDNSFHNAEHIRAVNESKQILVDEAIKGGEDPTDILVSLKNWNEMMVREGRDKEQISDDELKLIFKESVAAHDWGNIMIDIEIDENGEFKPIYLDGYTAKGAEDRSKEMYKKVLAFRLSKGELTKDEYDRRVSLGCHLIEMTKPKFPTPPEKELPKAVLETQFLVTVQIGDQIGNDYFSTNEERVDGLIEESAFENPNGTVNERAYRNFSVWRIIHLMPDEKKREALFRVWKKTPRENNNDYADSTTTFAELNSEIKKRNSSGAN